MGICGPSKPSKSGNVLQHQELPIDYENSRLVLVNNFCNFADSGPGDNWLSQDPHELVKDQLWPNGVHNLTQLGEFRAFRLGLELREQYKRFLGYNPNELLAFSASQSRCLESAKMLLRGLYDIEGSLEQNLARLACQQDMEAPPSGLAAPEAWRQVPIDDRSLPGLDLNSFYESEWAKQNPPADLLASEDLATADAQLGASVAVKRLLERFQEFTGGVKLNLSNLNTWTTLRAELCLAHSKDTLKLNKFSRDLVTELVDERDGFKLTMADVFEYCTLAVNLKTLENDVASYVLAGNLLTSLVESQLVAMETDPSGPQMENYRDRKVLVYVSQGLVLHQILQVLNLTRKPKTIKKNKKKPVAFEETFFELKREQADELEYCLAGLKQFAPGASLRFELRQFESRETDKKFPFVQAAIYNEQDGKFKPIQFKWLKFGKAMRKLFKASGGSKRELSNFYDSSGEFKLLDKDYSCPLELLRHVTSNLFTTDEKLQELGAVGGQQ